MTPDDERPMRVSRTEADDAILRRLLDATGGPRRKQVEAVLRQGGWGASLDDSTGAP